MKWLLISLAIGLVTSDKLDRTYLPPPGAKSSGGDLGTHDAPLEPPSHSYSGQGPVLGGKGAQSNFGINGKPVNFGDKILKVPVTTTSYAFSQTTTYPPGESFETTAFPINPVTGLPIGLEEGNFSFGSIPGQVPNSGTNIQSGIVPLGPTSVPVSNGSPGYDQYANQPLSQYPGQNVITRVGAPQVAESVHPGQNLDQLQYTSAGEVSSEQQVFQPTGAPDNRRLDQYLGQNIVIPGGVAQFPGDQRLVQYSDSQKVTGQQGFVPSTGSSINLQPVGNEQGVSYDGSQGTYTGQPIAVGGTEPTQPSYQNHDYNIGRIPSQNGNQNYGTSVPTGSVNVYQPGTTTSTVPSSYDNGVSSTTPFPALSSTTSAYSSVRPVYRPERPQAAADRSAVILNYENIRTPSGYSYSYDTSNGIHADESGIVDNGTKAQGSYSYIGDDGKLYSVIYTADENGFLPRGDHLPTPPPIPEAIQKIIEQAARDEAAGIVHDGSYDEAKYGDHLYQRNKHHRRPQIQDTNQFSNEKYNGANYDLIKLNVGTKDGEYDEVVEKHQFNNKITGTRKDLNGIILSTTPTNQRISESYVEDVSEGNEKVSEDFDTPKEDFTENTMPIIEKGLNHLNNYGTKKQGPGGRRPVLNEHNLPYDEAKDSNQNNQPELESHGPSMRRPTSSNKYGITEAKYPRTNVNIGAADHYKGGSIKNENQDNFGSPNVFNGSENTNTNFDKVTDSSIIEDKQQILKETVSDNKTPSSAGNKYNQNKNGRPQSESFPDKSAKTPSFLDYVRNPIVSLQETKQDDTRYQYQQPNTNFKQNKFPTRFGPQEVSSTQPVQPRNEYLEGTTRKPFITPNIYNQNNKNKEAISNKYHQNDNKGQSTTRRPFTTIGVTSPTDNSYTDYDDDGNDYATDQDISGDRISSTKIPTTYTVTSRPYQPTKTTPRTQNIPSSQRTRVIQKGSVTPGRRIETSGTITPGYTYGPTTQMPSQNSRFGSNEFPRRIKPQERKSNTSHDSVPAIGRPITTQPPSGTRHLDYRYQTTGPNYRYPGANSGSSYPTTVSYSGLSTMSTTPRVFSPQDYHTGTYGPSQGYSSTTTIPPTSAYTYVSGSQAPFRTPESLQSSQDQSFYTGYHYEPPKSGTLNTGVFPTSLTGTYQTTYQQGPSSFPSTTLGPIMPGSQGTYSTPHPGTFATMTSPTGTYQENYQKKPSTPVYATTILLGQKPEFTHSGSPRLQDTAGFKYGSSRPTFSTTDSPLTTTPGSFISSGTTGPSQDYSSTHPDLQITQDKFMGGPVDGFGRLVMIDQGGSKPGFQYLNQGTTGPEIGPNKSGTDHDQSTSYPGRFDETKVIGEDFSGPKQPQRYDPVTGYHYK